jgi:hypothetical protein
LTSVTTISLGSGYSIYATVTLWPHVGEAAEVVAYSGVEAQLAIGTQVLVVLTGGVVMVELGLHLWARGRATGLA